MSKLGPISWIKFVRRMRIFGWSGPFQEYFGYRNLMCDKKSDDSARAGGSEGAAGFG